MQKKNKYNIVTQEVEMGIVKIIFFFNGFPKFQNIIVKVINLYYGLCRIYSF